MCDSTFATPFHQRCLEVPGVDVAIHSATKYIGGHSDILAGAATAESGEFLHGVNGVSSHHPAVNRRRHHRVWRVPARACKGAKAAGRPARPLESF